MHPYIYELTVESIEVENARYRENQRWLRDLPKRPSLFQKLRGALTLRLMTLLRYIEYKRIGKRWEPRPQPMIDANCTHATTTRAG